MSDAAKLVADIVIGRTVIRQMRKGEVLPESFDVGFDLIGELNPDWVWVADKRGEIVGCVVASPCHSTVIVWRVVCHEPKSLLRLLRGFYRDVRSRGYRGYMTLLDTSVDTQLKLKSVIERTKGGTMDKTFILAAAPILEKVF